MAVEPAGGIREIDYHQAVERDGREGVFRGHVCMIPKFRTETPVNLQGEEFCQNDEGRLSFYKSQRENNREECRLWVEERALTTKALSIIPDLFPRAKFSGELPLTHPPR